MTSSLVGSEMCIRDRQVRDEHCRNMCTASPGSWSIDPFHISAVCHNCPVSYTHLTLPTICSV
eukprot:12237822-Prorocentrum_lima.AAC.1